MSKRKIILCLSSLLIIVSLISFTFFSGCACGIRRERIRERISSQLEESKEEQVSAEEKSVEEGTESEKQIGETGEESTEAEEEQKSETEKDGGETTEDQEETEGESSKEIETTSESQEETETETEENLETESAEESIEGLFATEIPVVIGESGTIVKDVGAVPGNIIQFGDNETNKPEKGFVSFNITSLAGCSIQSAKIYLTLTEKIGQPFEFKESICINVISWGTRAIQLEDFDKSGTQIGCYSEPNIGKSPEILQSEIQRTIDEGKKRFQICIFGKGPSTDNDNEKDLFNYIIAENGGAIRITITYSK